MFSYRHYTVTVTILDNMVRSLWSWGRIVMWEVTSARTPILTMDFVNCRNTFAVSARSFIVLLISLLMCSFDLFSKHSLV